MPFSIQCQCHLPWADMVFMTNVTDLEGFSVSGGSCKNRPNGIVRVKFSVGSTCLGKYSSYYLLTTTGVIDKI